MKTLYFDCFCGASGDMIVGALIDAGASFEVVQKALESLGVPGLHVHAEKTTKKGIVATQFHVDEHHHDHGHEGHRHDHPHRHLADIKALVEGADLPAKVKRDVLRTFQRIAECEASVHGATVEEIHFHEVGAIDSIADIVGAHLAMHLLEIDRVVASPLPVGSGTVKTAHGILPVPAPATAMLLKGVPSYAGDVSHEMVTPTGAALITQWAASYGAMPPMSVESIGYGSGTRDLADRANVLRVVIGQSEEALAHSEVVTVIETDIDDMNPELFPPLIESLLKGGARDAFLTPVLGKKGRPAYLVTVLCDPARTSTVARILFESSTTFGLRIREERRICLDRLWKKARTPWGEVRIKVGLLEGTSKCAAPEFEDCRRVAEENRVSVLAVYEAARAAAVKGDMEDV